MLAAVKSMKAWNEFGKSALMKSISAKDGLFLIDCKPGSPLFKAHGSTSSAYEVFTGWYARLESEYKVNLCLATQIPIAQVDQLPWAEWSECSGKELQEQHGIVHSLAKVLINALRGDAKDRMRAHLNRWNVEQPTGITPPLTLVKSWLQQIFGDRGDSKLDRTRKAEQAYQNLLQGPVRKHARTREDVEKWMSQFLAAAREMAEVDPLYATPGRLQTDLVLHLPRLGGLEGVLYDDLKTLTEQKQKEPGQKEWTALIDMSLSDIQRRVQERALQNWANYFDRPTHARGEGQGGRVAAVDRRADARGRGRGYTSYRGGGRGGGRGGRGSYRGGRGGHGPRPAPMAKRPYQNPEGFLWHAGYLVPRDQCFNCLSSGHSAAECTKPRLDKASRIQLYQKSGLEKASKVPRSEHGSQESK
jgi:hypothetical protein